MTRATTMTTPLWCVSRYASGCRSARWSPDGRESGGGVAAACSATVGVSDM
jgi:hypothetical protein